MLLPAILTLLYIGLQMAQMAGLSLVHRIQEAKNKRADHIREVEKLDVLLSKLQAESNALINGSALISLLPPEVLSMIFETGCQLARSSDRGPPFEIHFEILVSSLTRHLRDIAVNTPGLWTTVYITTRRSPDMIAAYFSRSRTLPLDMRVNIYYFSMSTDDILQNILLSLSRLRSLHVESASWRYLAILLRGLRPADAPALEALRFCHMGNGGGGEDEGYVSQRIAGGVFTGGMPSLKILQIRGIRINSRLLPLSTITSLHVHAMPPGPLVNLTVTPLTHLVIHGKLIPAPTTIPTLTSLALLSDYRPVSNFNVLNAIEAPMLETLYLEDVMDDTLVPALTGPQWDSISPRHPRLISLTLSLSPFYVRKLSPLIWSSSMRAFPTISYLTVLHMGIFSVSDALLPVDPASVTIIPWSSLKVLSLGGGFGSDVDSLSNVLSTRIALGIPLQRLRICEYVRFDNSSGWDPTLEDVLQQLRRHTEVELYNINNKRWPIPSNDDWIDLEDARQVN